MTELKDSHYPHFKFCLLTNTKIRLSQAQTLRPALEVVVNICAIGGDGVAHWHWWWEGTHCKTFLNCFPVDVHLLIEDLAQLSKLMRSYNSIWQWWQWVHDWLHHCVIIKWTFHSWIHLDNTVLCIVVHNRLSYWPRNWSCSCPWCLFLNLYTRFLGRRKMWLCI